MPLYHFECQACGKRFEELTSYDRRGDVTCPACQSATRVLVSGFAVGGSSSGSSPAPVRSPFT